MSAKSRYAQVYFRIADIELIEHFEHDPKKLKLTKRDVESAEVKVGLDIELDTENNYVTLKPIVGFCCNKKGKDLDIFGAKVLYKFEIKNFDLYFDSSEKSRTLFFSQFLEQLLGITLAGMRGMFVLLNKQPYYKKAILPLIDPKPFLAKFTNHK